MIKTIIIPVIIFLYGCKSTGYFNSPNTISKKETVVHMLDGSKKMGLLTVSLEANHVADFVVLENGSVSEKVLIDSIRAYTLNNEMYVPKNIMIDFDGPLRLLFVKKLTPDTSRIQFYEFFQNQEQGNLRESLLLYYISFPSFDRLETWGMGHKNLVPNFHRKMSAIVADCPALSQKIQAQEKGYYFTQMTLSNITKKEVLQRIINEYNLCAASK
jgi:hypothetical protein